MKQILLNWCYAILLFSGTYSLKGQCPSSGILYLDTQEKIDNFIIQYPNCTQIDGILKIQGLNNPISNFNGLKNITKTKGLQVEYTASPTLEGLHNITSINGSLILDNNQNLTNLSALNQITSVEALVIISNNKLTDINELSKLTTVQYYVDINQNDLLASLSGLSNLTSIGDNFNLRYNNSITNLNGLQNLKKVGSLKIELMQNLMNVDSLSNLTELTGSSNFPGLTIYGNSALSNIEGLIKLTTVANKAISIGQNSKLTSLKGLDNIDPNSISEVYINSSPKLSACSVPSICKFISNGGTAYISENAAGCRSSEEITTYCTGSTDCPIGNVILTSQADVDDFASTYPNCKTILGDLIIGKETDSSNIINISALSKIETVLGNIAIKGNVSLVNLTGLNALKQVVGDLTIVDNINLDNINALLGLESINDHAIIIKGNAKLRSLKGLDNIDPHSINNLILESSQNLSTCNVSSICQYLSFFESIYTISGNATGCSSQQEIMKTCESVLPQCPTEELSFTTQTALDHFLVQYPNCTVLPKDVYIGYEWVGPSNITNLQALQNITEIKGGLKFEWTSVPHLNGLNNLTKVGGTLSIDRVGSLQGIQNLVSVGSLEFLNNPDISNLEALDNLKYIGHSISIQGTSLTSLKGLESITDIPGNLSIAQNPSLVSLQGLNNLTKISENNTNGQLYISYNPLIENLQGLNNLQTLGYGSVNISNNDALKNFDGLEKLTHIGGELRIDFNPVLTSIEALSNLEELNVYGSNNLLQIAGNPVLESLSAFSKLTRAGSINIVDNDALTSLYGFHNITRLDHYTSSGPDNDIDTNLWIEHNDKLKTLNFDKLIFLGKNLEIVDNPALENLQVLTKLTNVGCNLRIAGNISLPSLEGLNNIPEIGSYARCFTPWLQITKLPLVVNLAPLENLITVKPTIYDVQNNENLKNLKGLEKISADKIEALFIKNSSKLSVCNASNICQFLINGNYSEISNNATGCNSREEIIKSCALGVTEMTDQNDVSIYPVPTQHILNIESRNGSVLKKVRIYDLSGKLVFSSEKDLSKIDISHYPSGTYLVTVETSKGIYREKIIKK